jgi:alanine racemase
MSIMGHNTWIEVDLGAIRSNVRRLGEISRRPVMAVIKANAYGHGLVDVGRAALQAGAAWLVTARLDESLALRHAGISAPLFVLGYAPPERVPEAAAAGVRLAVYDEGVAAVYSAQAQSAGHKLVIHAKFDTGMGRLGAAPEAGAEFISCLKQLPGLEVEGVFTHMAEADDPVQPTTDRQLDRFDRMLESLRANDLRPRLVHAANSASTLYFPRAYYDMVRPGIAIYGLNPSAEAPLKEGFVPALSWKARLVSVKMIPAGQGIGYNFRYRTTHEERIGVCSVGYADGFRRRLGNSVLVGGRRVPVVGGVCMDQCMVQLDAVPEAKIGDEVVLIGRQGDARITPEEIAQDWGTSCYEVVSGLAARVPRVYAA